jgi:hypothetical protein
MKTAWIAVGLALLGAPAIAATTINATHPHAYGANVGWLNARGDTTNGAAIGPLFCTGYVWSANCGWICLGNGPTNGWQYSNAASNDWGVNHDGLGNLTGYAYGANIGWIQFEQTHGQPRIDLRTGDFSGYAWGANVGWIGFSNAQAFVQTDTLAPGPDTDLDGIPDPWEMQRAGNLTTLGGSYPDGDNVPDADEYVADTDPLKDDHLEIVSLTKANGTNTVGWTSRPTRLYRVEATNLIPLVPSDWTDVGGGLIGPPPGSPAQAGIALDASTSKYYRVKAVVPLSE